MFVNVTLALLIVFNRRRIGDVQFLKIADYQNDHRSNSADFENALTETEKMLTNKYKRVMNSGKGSRAVVILLPKPIEAFIDLLLKNRHKYISMDNEYGKITFTIKTVIMMTIKYGLQFYFLN
jgi:hypothetical protein